MMGRLVTERRKGFHRGLSGSRAILTIVIMRENIDISGTSFDRAWKSGTVNH
jgi:hypothetical protein